MASKIAALLATISLAAAVVDVAGSSAMTESSQRIIITNTNNNNNLRKLSGYTTNTNTNGYRGNGAFVDGTETVYDDLSMAWRFLGFYTDCNVCLDGDGDNGDGDNSGDDEQFADPSDCLGNNGQDTTVCRRYALWAAYVDEGYNEGTNGASDYQYYDRHQRRWDTSACDSNGDTAEDSRCVKMDCHNPSSKNFKLIGVYKDHKTTAFLETMMDYSGDCVWNDDEYKFMNAMNSNNNNNNNNNEDSEEEEQQEITYWPPKKCTAFEHNNNGSVVGYYDAVPTASGNLGVALYNDASCTVPYEGTDVTAEEIVGRARSLNNNEDFADDMESWNAAMDAFKICQPCISYDTLYDKDTYNAKGDRYGDKEEDENENENDDEDGGDDEDEPFVCRDNRERDEPINQCQLFVEDGGDTMTVASYRDILLAESQGTVTGIDVSPSSDSRRGGMVLGKSFVRPKHLWLSIGLLLASMGYFWCVLARLFEKDRSKHGTALNEPLVVDDAAANNGQQRSTTNNNSNHNSNHNSNNNSNNSSSNNSSSKSVSTAAAVATIRKTKEQKAAEKEEKAVEKSRKKDQKQLEKLKTKKSILKNSKKYDDHDNWSFGEESTHYSAYQL